MKTFVVLIPVDNSLAEPRRACEMIENKKFSIDNSAQATAIDVLDKVMFELGGVPEEFARYCFKLAAHKLPIRTKFITRHK